MRRGIGRKESHGNRIVGDGCADPSRPAQRLLYFTPFSGFQEPCRRRM